MPKRSFGGNGRERAEAAASAEEERKLALAHSTSASTDDRAYDRRDSAKIERFGGAGRVLSDDPSKARTEMKNVE
jgi:hypothetical protein